MTRLKSWTNHHQEEEMMSDDHDHLWQGMIDNITEGDLSGLHVLDYGCNQGRFLKKLYAQRHFKSGIGVDVVSGPLAAAREETRTGQPLEYYDAALLPNYRNHFDLAFSHEVLYLLDDLDAHAATMGGALKDGGVYYAAIGCHTGNPGWHKWRDMIAEYSNITPQDYSLDDYAAAFFKAGFKVSARTYKYDGFVPLKAKNDYFPTVMDSLDYHDRYKVLFRFVKGA